MARSRKSTKGPTKASKASSSSTRPPQDTHLNEAESFNKKKKQQAVHVETTIEKRHEKCWAQNHLLEKRRYFLLFGTFLGMLSMLIFHHGGLNEEILPIPSEMMKELGEKFNIELNFEWSKRIKEDILASFDNHPLMTSEKNRPGLILHQKKIHAFSPVIMIPGFTSTGLEIWNGSECSKSYFRQRMWGTTRMLQQFMLNQKCWLEHVMLNATTGLDPEGIKLRPANGLEAADYVIGGFWVWGKIIENLADIGYDTNNMFMAAYDWRMAPFLLEKRDKYFTKLKFMIEMAKKTNENRKIVIISHSYGYQIVFFFLKWVESQHGGKAGSKWVDDHIESFINIAGTTLGSIKSTSALLSGEMKDTAELGGLSKFLEFFFSHPARTLLARSWSSVFSMLPIGGETIWGNTTFAPDDIVSIPSINNPQQPIEEKNVGHTNGILVALQTELFATKTSTDSGSSSSSSSSSSSNVTRQNVTAGQIRDFLSKIDGNLKKFNEWFSSGIATDDLSLPKYDQFKYWTNPLESALPKAPNMKFFCLYGIGKPVERAYAYHPNSMEKEEQVYNKNGDSIVPYMLDTTQNDPPWISLGIRYVDGDGTVPLISLGFMCAKGWRKKKYNPSQMEIRIREYRHNPLPLIYDPRGGPSTSDHVDIMGNHEMITDILNIVAKKYDQVPEQIHSEILKIAQRVELPE